MDTKTRLLKAIDFFRLFSDKASTDLYKKSVLKFCDLVAEYLDKTDAPEKESQYQVAEKIFTPQIKETNYDDTKGQ